ncbi:hypothetical protein [Photobacterium ganghwense]|uniref:hypothetical protein n=1 Tax=Photobacterium ganghwense TaxID=320778 RepID=UPI0039EE82BF
MSEVLVGNAMKPKVIYHISDSYRSKNGWVYFLLSQDKRYLKIGKTNADLSARINAANSIEIFKENQFKLLLAYSDSRLEGEFLSYFGKYRARYNWLEPTSIRKHLTYDELWKIATYYSRTKHGFYRKNHVTNAIQKYGQTTRDELCKIPPKKLAPKLVYIIEEKLGLVKI